MKISNINHNNFSHFTLDTCKLFVKCFSMSPAIFCKISPWQYQYNVEDN